MAKVRMLRFGRHFQVGENVRLILGRNQEENRSLSDLAAPEVVKGRMTLYQPLFPAPLAVAFGPESRKVSEEAARFILRYSKKRGDSPDEAKIEVSCGEIRYRMSVEKSDSR
jgi:hypothetical protein